MRFYLDENIFNFRLLNSLSSTISNLAVEKLSNALRSYLTKSRPVKPQKLSTKPQNSDDQPPVKDHNLNNIFRQPFAKLSDILQGAKLIDASVKRDFGVDNTSLMELQKMDLDLKPFYDMAMENNSTDFVLKNRLLSISSSEIRKTKTYT